MASVVNPVVCGGVTGTSPSPLSLTPLLKRPLPELTDPQCDSFPGEEPFSVLDGTAAQAKKRRKQSRPVRLTQGKEHGDKGDETGDNDVADEEGVLSASDGEMVICGEKDENSEDSVNVGDIDNGRLCDADVPLNLSSFLRPDSASAINMVETILTEEGTRLDKDTTSVSMNNHPSSSSKYHVSTDVLFPFTRTIYTPGAMPTRIFNPDAYCALCNKEFCNKYFLKTHKANKHGIFTDNPVSTANSCPAPMPLTCPTLLQSPIPPISLKFSPVPIRNSGPKSTIIDEKYNVNFSYNICQKKSPNKLNIKKPKSKGHTFSEDSESVQTFSSASGDGVKKNIQDCSILETQSNSMSSVNSVTDVGEEITRPLAVSHVRCEISEPMPSLSDIKREKGTNDQEFFSASTGDFVQEANALSSDHLRKLGVINADAFCEICCKEYCNKYFLRTHKLKRHGIVTADDVRVGPQGEVSSKGDSASVKGSSDVGNSSSPLNLILSDTGDNGDTGLEVNECDICGRKFQNAQFLHLHRTNMHRECSLPGSGTSHPPSPSLAGPNLTAFSLTVPTLTIPTLNVPSTIPTNVDGQNEVVSEDLKKLQTMILQLNHLNVHIAKSSQPAEDQSFVLPGKNGSVCQKTLKSEPNDLTLPNQESKLPLNDIFPLSSRSLSPREQDDIPIAHNAVTSNNPSCSPCVSSMTAVPTSSFEGAKVRSLTPGDNILGDSLDNEELESLSDINNTRTPNPHDTVSEKRFSLTPASSYCEICNKELCNKYFMKTHMQRMHGIEIENGSQIGGVKCNICNKELCSKYFLRVHKQNTHGVAEGGSREIISGQLHQVSNLAATKEDSAAALKPNDLSDLSNRYFSHFKEVCPICGRRFRSSKWLKAHILNDHWQGRQDKLKDSARKKQSNKSHITDKEKMCTDSDPPASTELKIPSMCDNRDQVVSIKSDNFITEDNHRIFSTLFGTWDSNTNSYKCSYCPFSTPVLAYLFVHERTHSNISQSLSEPDKPLKCPVCFQSFLHRNVFKHHILMHHMEDSLDIDSTNVERNVNHSPAVCSPSFVSSEMSHITDSPVGTKGIDQDTTNQQEFDDNLCPFCFSPFASADDLTSHLQEKHGESLNTSAVLKNDAEIEIEKETLPTRLPVISEPLTTCSNSVSIFTSPHVLEVRKHVVQENNSRNWMEMENTKEERVVTPLLEMQHHLQEVARASHVPATYAEPQASNPFVMQPFLLKEPQSTSASKTRTSSPLPPTPAPTTVEEDSKFVPALVFLPVRKKLSEPLTVAFTLTPA